VPRVAITLDQETLAAVEALAVRLHHPTQEALLAYLVSEGLKGTEATLQRADAMDSAPAGDARYG